MHFWISSLTPLFDTICSFSHRRLCKSTQLWIFGGLGWGVLWVGPFGLVWFGLG